MGVLSRPEQLLLQAPVVCENIFRRFSREFAEKKEGVTVARRTTFDYRTNLRTSLR